MSYPTGPRRYRLVRLRDGRVHASDNLNPRLNYLLTPHPARRSAYALAGAGEIHVESGRLTRVSDRAATSGYRVTQDRAGTVRFTRVDDPRWQLAFSSTGAVTPWDRFAVIDLRDGGLLLLDAAGVQELAIQPAGPLDPTGRQANPDIEQFEDFAP